METAFIINPNTKPVPISQIFKQTSFIIPLFDVGAWSGFTNQPADDGVEVLSNSASDVGKLTIFGTTHGTGAFAYETITLNGVTAVATTKVDWGNVYVYVCWFYCARTKILTLLKQVQSSSEKIWF